MYMTYMARLTGCSDRNILLKCNLFWEFNFLLKARLKLQREHFFSRTSLKSETDISWFFIDFLPIAFIHQFNGTKNAVEGSVLKISVWKRDQSNYQNDVLVFGDVDSNFYEISKLTWGHEREKSYCVRIHSDRPLPRCGENVLKEYLVSITENEYLYFWPLD